MKSPDFVPVVRVTVGLAPKYAVAQCGWLSDHPSAGLRCGRGAAPTPLFSSRPSTMSSCSSVSDGSSDETAGTTSESSRPSDAAQASSQRRRNLVPAASVLIALIAVAVVLFTGQPASWLSSGMLPLNPREAADEILSKAPVIVRPAPPPLSFSSTFAPPANRRFFPPPISPFPHSTCSAPWTDFFPMNARMVISTLHGSCA
jgi:hypothetical protein